MQVPTLKLCKKLKECGYLQEGKLWWIIPSGAIDPWVHECRLSEYECVVAPLASEILEELPEVTIRKLHRIGRRSFEATYKHNNGLKIYFENDTLCNALAELYCYLKTQGLIK